MMYLTVLIKSIAPLDLYGLLNHSGSNWDFFFFKDHHTKLCVWYKPNTAQHQETHHPHHEAWWWQHHAVWRLLCRGPWKVILMQ